MIQELEQDNLQEVISQHEKVIVQYGVRWCGNCRIIKTKMKRLSIDFSEIKFLYVDAEKLPNSRKLAEVTNLPTLAAFINGHLIGQTQTNKEENLKTLINEIAYN